MESIKMLPARDPRAVKTRTKFNKHQNRSVLKIKFSRWRRYFLSQLLFAEIAKRISTTRATVSAVYNSYFIEITHNRVTGNERQRRISQIRWSRLAKRFPKDTRLYILAKHAKAAGYNFEQVPIIDINGKHVKFRTDELWVDEMHCRVVYMKNIYWYGSCAYSRAALLRENMYRFQAIIFYVETPDRQLRVFSVPITKVKHAYKNYKGDTIRFYIPMGVRKRPRNTRKIDFPTFRDFKMFEKQNH
ncbi:MAG: hypothetical protein G01um101433_610 [Parcubacteria group bacterium Gr01-1014_33]|nr:MAG: hypothetical protein G01um101433_610 [Parcubacteria group bacterium Gr01-1014_33]